MLDERLVQAFKNFCAREYEQDIEPEVDENGLLRVAYTTVGDREEHELQVSIDTQTWSWVYEVDGTVILVEECSLDGVIEDLNIADFNDVIRAGVWEWSRPETRIKLAIVDFAMTGYGESEEDASWSIDALAKEITSLFNELKDEM